MDFDRPNGKKICASSGYDVGKETPHESRTNSITPGNEPGSAILEGEGEGCHEWELSYDGGVTSKYIRATTSGRKTLTGEKPDTDIWQRNCLVLSNETYGEWTDWVQGKTGR